MRDTRQIISEFDPELRVLHISAERPVLIDDQAVLEEIMTQINADLCDLSGRGRCYLMLDISRIVVEPQLAEHFFESLKRLREDHLFPEGLVRYGLQLGRNLVQVDQKSLDVKYTAVVRTSSEARKYIDRLRRTSQGLKSRATLV